MSSRALSSSLTFVADETVSRRILGLAAATSLLGHAAREVVSVASPVLPESVSSGLRLHWVLGALYFFAAIAAVGALVPSPARRTAASARERWTFRAQAVLLTLGTALLLRRSGLEFV
ncbi:MAG TPA: hypothetical protein VGJ84_03785, partial [Polyangiaceae bacterium]